MGYLKRREMIEYQIEYRRTAIEGGPIIRA
jgi:hypothetical protein